MIGNRGWHIGTPERHDLITACRRRLDLDWLRIIAFGLLILYHINLLYVAWPYHAKSRHSLPRLVVGCCIFYVITLRLQLGDLPLTDFGAAI